MTAPIYFRPSPAAIEEHFRQIAADSPVGVLVYNIPAFAVPIPVEVTARLAQLPNVVGVKDSSGGRVGDGPAVRADPAGAAGFFDPHRVGRGPAADARRRRLWRHERHRQRRPGACAGSLRPLSPPATGTPPAPPNTA